MDWSTRYDWISGNGNVGEKGEGGRRDEVPGGGALGAAHFHGRGFRARGDVAVVLPGYFGFCLAEIFFGGVKG